MTWIQISGSGSGKQRVEHIPHGPEDGFVLQGEAIRNGLLTQ